MKTFGLVNPPGKLLLRGPMLWPDPDCHRCTITPDGAAVIDRSGVLIETGPFSDVASRHPDAVVEDAGGTLAPAFADMHLHWVQHQVMGKFGGALLPWLKQCIFPAEQRLMEPALRAEAADAFWAALHACGTTMAAIYASSFPESVADCLSRATGVVACGDSLMTCGVDGPLLREAGETIAGVEAMAKRWGGGYAVTPRFALSAGLDVMRATSAIAREHGLVIQTHLSENLDEVAEVRRLYPDFESYTEVYDGCGVLGDRTILAHCIHLSEREWALLAERRCLVAHCPSSNLALGSGRMDIDAARRHGVNWVLASDIGAGPDLCQLDVIRAFMSQHLGVAEVSWSEAFARATINAVPARFKPADAPAGLLVLTLEAKAGESADAFVERLAHAYRGDPAAVIRRVRFGGEWLVDR